MKLLSAVMLLATVSAAVPPNILTSQLVEAEGVKCLDGTPQRYWIRKAAPGSANMSKWAFHFMGGGWCTSVESCTSRGFSDRCYVGSSNPGCFLNETGNMLPGNLSAFNETMPITSIPSLLGARWSGGLAINDAATNPITYDWNFVEMSYCSGGSYVGYNETATEVSTSSGTQDMWFRGGTNMEAVFDHLEANHGLADASHVIVSGDSAGGLATYWHTDRIAKRLSKAFTVGVPDSGFFLGVPSDKPSWPLALQWIGQYMNGTEYLQETCVAEALRSGKDPTVVCTLPEDVAPHIQSPVFAFNSRFDPALDDISAGISSGNTAEVNRVGGLVLSTINATVVQTSPINAAFVSACHEHCGQWSQFQKLGPNGEFDDFWVRTEEGVTVPDAVGAWFHAVEALWQQWRLTRVPGEHAFESTLAWRQHLRRDTGDAASASAAIGQRLYLQPASYPCQTCCSGGNT